MLSCFIIPYKILRVVGSRKCRFQKAKDRTVFGMVFESLNGLVYIVVQVVDVAVDEPVEVYIEQEY